MVCYQSVFNVECYVLFQKFVVNFWILYCCDYIYIHIYKYIYIYCNVDKMYSIWYLFPLFKVSTKRKPFPPHTVALKQQLLTTNQYGFQLASREFLNVCLMRLSCSSSESTRSLGFWNYIKMAVAFCMCITCEELLCHITLLIIEYCTVCPHQIPHQVMMNYIYSISHKVWMYSWAGSTVILKPHYAVRWNALDSINHTQKTNF